MAKTSSTAPETTVCAESRSDADGVGTETATEGVTSAASWPVPSSADFVAAIVLVVGPFAGAQEHVITGSVLLAFAAAWAMLAVLSERWTDQPQRWAFVPAVFMALAGVQHPRPRADRQRGSAGCGRRSSRRSRSG